MVPAWYLARAVGRSDDRILSTLAGLGVEHYYPRILEMRPLRHNRLSLGQRRSGIEVRAPHLVPLFPRYVFARLELSRPGWREAFNIAGLAGLVYNGGNLPVRVPDAMVETIRNVEGDKGIPGSVTTRIVFAVGDQVRINSGPFGGHVAAVARALDIPIAEVDPHTRLRVALALFGRQSIVELDLWRLDKV